MMLEGKSGSCFSSLDSSIDILKKRAQELIENINESRQKDHALMTNFRDSLKIKVTDSPHVSQKPRERGGGAPSVKHKAGGDELLLGSPRVLDSLRMVPHFTLRAVLQRRAWTHIADG